MRRGGQRQSKRRLPGGLVIPPNPVAITSDTVLWLEQYQDWTTVERGGVNYVSAQADQANDHDASQGTDADQPLAGPSGDLSQAFADFDGTDDYMTIAAGAGWPAHTSHSVFVLLNVRDAASSNQILLQKQGNGLIVSALTNTAGQVGWFDGTWQSVGAAAAGWQILEYHLDADATSGEVIRDAVSVGTAPYAAVAMGNLGLGSVYAGTVGHFDGQLASLIIVSRATGHPTGVTSAAERAQIRDYQRWVSGKIGVTLP